MKEPVARTAAIAATVGFAGLGLFQFLLAAGAPIGEAAWGGTNEGRLPMRLRVGSGIAIVIYGAVAVARSSPAGVVGAGKRSRPRAAQ